ncbi:uncharacterized protein LOC122501299 [Leptopilina heterotoma]|uniref:uncharacterized protein LOC122501299 n=1 Tax=Leptopilina heterotoma TaxID=63436 RepID=UPI001CA8DE31|nr:uncharacterized protein LOC122501299 [Leptopilina heterotoma]
MKLLLVLSIFLICVTFSFQKVKYVNCTDSDEIHSKISENNCYEIRCSFNKFGSLRLKVDCPESKCVEGTQISYKEVNNALIYPNCCGEPLCENKINNTYSIIL